MTTEQIITKIKSKKNDLKQAWITHLQLFGSFARGDFHDDSDIDLLYEFDPEQDKTGRWVRWKRNLLEEITWRSVDMVGKDFINNFIKDSVLSNVINIY
jgi:uncharacterized protein